MKELHAGVIARGNQGEEPLLLKIAVYFGGLSPPENLVSAVLLKSVLTLLPKCFVLLWSMLHCSMVI